MTKKKGHQKFWGIKRHFLRKSWFFFRRSAIFSRNLPKRYRNLTLGFLGFFYWPILGFQFFWSGNTAGGLQGVANSNSNSNYNSFILRPLKEVYSGALPAMQPRSNNEVLKPRKIRSEWATGVRRSATGRPFQAVGPATEKALSDNSPRSGDQDRK